MTQIVLRSLVMQPDGKSVAVGFQRNGAADFYVTRYLANGAVDSAFGANGGVALSVSNSDDDAMVVKLQSDGKLLLSGYSNMTGWSSFNASLTRFNSDGTIDNTFGGGSGYTLVSFYEYNVSKDINVQADGKIYLTAYTTPYRDEAANDLKNSIGIARFNPNGSLDSTFGIGGKAIIENHVLPDWTFLSIQSNGKIITTGSTSQGNGWDAFAARMNSDGTLDLSYGINGLATAGFSGNQRVRSALQDSDGNLFISGVSESESTYDFFLTKLNADGDVDSRFNNGSGITYINFGGNDSSQAAALQDDGKIILAGMTDAIDGTGALALTRIMPNGTIDAKFGIGGRTVIDGVDDNNPWFEVTDVKTSIDGRIVALFTTGYTSATIAFASSGKLLAGYITGSVDSDSFSGTDSTDRIYGLEGVDYIEGGTGDDYIDGGEDDDTLAGGDGNDQVHGGSGDDLIIGGDGRGDDRYYGGNGVDTLKYTSATWDIKVDLRNGTAHSMIYSPRRSHTDAANIGIDRLYEIENIIAGNFNDVLTGSSADNHIHGGGGNDILNGVLGNDTLDGGIGMDTASYAELTTAVIANLTEGIARIGTETDTLISIEHLIGGSSADHLTGDRNDNILAGGAGNDILHTGWDELTLRGGNDKLRGGTGNDIYKIHKSTALYDDIIIDELADRGAGTDTLEIYEDLTIGPDVDSVTRDAILNDDGSITMQFYVDGAATGSFTIRGQIEYIINSGKDQYGEWTPLKIQTWYAGQRWKLDQSAALTLGFGTAQNDNLVGSSKADFIYGFSGDDTLTGGLGDDILDGGGGADTTSYGERTVAVIAKLAEGIARIGSELDTLISIENLVGGRADDELTGNHQANTLNGGSGNDVLDGAGGDDMLLGGLGNDRYRIHEVVGGNDMIQDSGGLDALDWVDYGQDYVMDMARVGPQGRDLAITFRDIKTGDLLQSTTIKGQFSISSRLGSSAIETFYGMEYDDNKLVYGGPTLKFVGGLVGDADNNIIVGLAQADRIDGGEGMDAIFAGAGDDTVRGGSGDDVISGGFGSDRLFGDAGDDQLRGDAGNDVLTGGDGSDEFWFRSALDSTTNLDTITDFVHGNDKICLSSQLFRELNGQINESNFLANQTGQAEDADDRLIFNTGTRTLYYDADGLGGESSIAFVTLTGVPSVSVSDLLLIG